MMMGLRKLTLSVGVGATSAILLSNNSGVMADVLPKSAAELHSIIAASNDEQRSPNFIFSPYSIFAVSVMAARGAGGKTLRELSRVVDPENPMTVPDLSKEYDDYTVEATLAVANRLYTKKELEDNSFFKAYKKDVCTFMDASAEVVNFNDSKTAVATMNDFVARTTKDHITDLVPESAITEDTSLVLVNALYFKARWAEQFKKGRTTKGVFYALTQSGGRVEKPVQYMNHTYDNQVMYYEDKDARALALPYVSSGLFMYVVVPRDMQKFEKMMENGQLVYDHYVQNVRNSFEANGDSELVLSLPKFKLKAVDNKQDLQVIFQKMGISNMFTRGVADFSRINGDSKLYVSSFLHQADIAVDEEGTEATASTAMGITNMSMPLPKTPVHVVVDSPFLFQIRYSEKVSWGEYKSVNEDLIFFSGRIADAAAAQ